MSPLDTPRARPIRRTSVALTLTGVLLLPWPSALDAGWPQAGLGDPLAMEVSAVESPPAAARPVEAGAAAAGGVAGVLLALVLLVVSANVAGMLVARVARWRVTTAAPAVPLGGGRGRWA